MKYTLNFLVAVLLLSLGVTFTSCSDSDDSLDDATVENFVDRTVFGFQGLGGIGKFGCYEFVFPIEFTTPDGATISVDSYADLRVALAQFIVDNQDTTGIRPTLVYPLEVTNDEGEIITVEGPEDMRALRRECRKDFYDHIRNRGHKRGDHCFMLTFPVELSLPDGTTVSADSKMELKQAARAWKAENPDAEERPELVFPVSIEFADGSTATIESKEGFKRVREACSEG